MKIKLPYDNKHIIAEIDEQRVAAILSPHKYEKESGKSQREIIKEALFSPVESKPLSCLAQEAHNILIITSDHTRPMPSKITIPVLLDELEHINPQANIKILIATGCHRVSNQKEMLLKFGWDIIDSYEIINHDCDNKEPVFKGVLPSGGELWVNKLVDWADLIIAEGFIEPHFFAGFSGGRKSILPGIAARKTILENHCSEFINSEYAHTGNLKNNPIHEDMMAASKLAGLDFILNVVLDEDKNIIQAYAGHPEEAHKKGCTYLKQLFKTEAVKADIVITTNGGYPLDQNIYQAVKGMTAAETCVNQGGVIIMISSCKAGHGGEYFYKLMRETPSPSDLLDKIINIPRSDTLPDQWQAQILARVLKKCSVIIVADENQVAIIEDMHMHYSKSIGKALEMAGEFVGRNAPIAIIPDGVSIIMS